MNVLGLGVTAAAIVAARFILTARSSICFHGPDILLNNKNAAVVSVPLLARLEARDAARYASRLMGMTPARGAVCAHHPASNWSRTSARSLYPMKLSTRCPSYCPCCRWVLTSHVPAGLRHRMPGDSGGSGWGLKDDRARNRLCSCLPGSTLRSGRPATAGSRQGEPVMRRLIRVSAPPRRCRWIRQGLVRFGGSAAVAMAASDAQSLEASANNSFSSRIS